jgi:LysM repeat protein
MVYQRKRAVIFWRVVIVLIILAIVGGMGFVLVQFSSGTWTLFATQTPTATFTPTQVVATATQFIPSDTPTPQPTPTRGAPITYTVVAGDTITTIGQKFGVDVETLIAYNNLKSTVLSINQQIAIPPSDYVFVAPSATPIPTNLRPGTYISYTIKAGDILGVIAEKFNSRSIDIINANKQALPDPNNIPVGTTIRIPYNSILITPTRTPRP